jgi:DNA-binding Lrp family transcriptional regulator
MENPLSEKKRIVLGILRENARAKKADIARRLDIPLSSASQIIKGVEKDLGLRYTSLLDYKQMGHNTRTAFVVDAKKSLVLGWLSDHECVNNLYRIEENVFFVEAVFRCMKDMADFADEITEMGAQIRKEFYIIDDMKREEFGV